MPVLSGVKCDLFLVCFEKETLEMMYSSSDASISVVKLASLARTFRSNSQSSSPDATECNCFWKTHVNSEHEIVEVQEKINGMRVSFVCYMMR
jgi:hypothetical protein